MFALHGERKDCLLMKNGEGRFCWILLLPQLTENTRLLMRVFSLANGKSQSQHHRQTHPLLRSTPAESESVHSVLTSQALSSQQCSQVQGQQKCRQKGEYCPGCRAVTSATASVPRIDAFWFNQCHSKWLSLMLTWNAGLWCPSSLASTSSHSYLCHRDCKRQRDEEEGGHIHPSLRYATCLLIAISSCFQLLLVAVSFFPTSSGCPALASSKSQPLSGETAAGGNWFLSSITTGAASRAGFLPILALLWLLYCSCTARRPVASCPQSQELSGYSPRTQKLLIPFFTEA